MASFEPNVCVDEAMVAKKVPVVVALPLMVEEAYAMMPLVKPIVVEVELPYAIGVNGKAKRFAEVR